MTSILATSSKISSAVSTTFLGVPLKYAFGAALIISNEVELLWQY